jgi:SAM-dependent methyltransferase
VASSRAAGQQGTGLKPTIKGFVRNLLPLAVRKHLAIWLDRQRWLRSGKWWAVELLRDFAEKDISAYHRFLWSNHMAYAETYDVEQRIGARHINQTRHMLFDDLIRLLRKRGSDPSHDVRSIFEVGCSLGYLLRYLETEIFPSAELLEGIDIDDKAVTEGERHLRSTGSRVRLYAGDMDALPDILGARIFDLIFCCGVLMYVTEEEAQKVVTTMLDHAGLVVITGLAHADMDNSRLDAPAIRERDGTFIYNIDRMVERAGGRVVFRRWEGDRMVDGNTVYFVVGERSA